MSVLVLRGDARSLPLPDASVDLICTSPPYFGLRDYRDNNESMAGQIGSEPTPAEYIDNLIACTREWVRVLKPTGSIFVDLGDKYGPNKSLLHLPERYRIACTDTLHLISRAVICWSKPNGLPESVTDRVRRSHEDWVHLVKQPRYFSAVDEIRTPHLAKPQRRLTAHENRALGNTDRKGGWSGLLRDQPQQDGHPLGALPGSVWEIATEPLQVPDHLGIDHFAAFPTEWPRRIILGWSPSGICTACGEGRRPVVSGGGLTDAGRALLERRGGHASQAYLAKSGRNDADWGLSLNVSGPERQRHANPHRITGEACACPDTTAPTQPAVVLDPFGGTGTTALVAAALGRIGVTVDRSADYCRLAAWRTTDRGEIAKAMRMPKPEKPVDGQEVLDLFA